MTTKINVLPVINNDVQGFVRLVDHMGSDLSIVRCARISYDAEWRSGQDAGKDEKLINYLVSNRHTSPLEAVEFQFEVKAPLFVIRQWQRHRSWSYSELSLRYADHHEGFYIPDPRFIGSQSKDNKQVRIIEKVVTEQELALRTHETATLQDHFTQTYSLYRKLIESGWARELARGVLPTFTYSRMFAKVDLHNLLHFVKLRMHNHAQWEIQQYANAIVELIKPIVPVTYNAFCKYIANGN